MTTWVYTHTPYPTTWVYTPNPDPPWGYEYGLGYQTGDPYPYPMIPIPTTHHGYAIPMQLPSYGANWYQHSGYSDLPHGHDLPQDNNLSTGSASGNLVPNISLSPVSDSQPDLDYPPLPPSKDSLASNQGERRYKMDVGTEQKFIETFPDCSNSYTGRFTFMDLFWQDEHAEE